MPVKLVTQPLLGYGKPKFNSVFLSQNLNLNFTSLILQKDPTHPAIASLGPVCQNLTMGLDGSSVKIQCGHNTFPTTPTEKLKPADKYCVSRLSFGYLTPLWQAVL